MINEIFNGDSASSIRAKLNEMITIVNHYSSSQFVGGGGDPYTPPPGGGGGAGTAILWDNDMYATMGTMDSMSACSAINMNSSHTVYIQKDPANMGGTSVPEMGDYLFTDEAFMMNVPSNYYGWNDTAMMMNKVIQVGPGGVIQSVNYC